MKPITQEEINDLYPEIIKDLDDEIIRTKEWANKNGYHVATAIYPIIKRYRNELKTLREVLRMNIE